MLILVTNDDSINAKGIGTLLQIATEYGEVVVVAPDSPQSGQSNALTINTPLRYKEVENTPTLKRYSCNGTPTDCVKIALNDILDRKPDLLISGINHGSNAAINVIYSGTMGAVLEGCENKIPAIGFSICDHSPNADFTPFTPYIRNVLFEQIANPLPYGICLNVNAPKGKIKGIKVTRQCRGSWTEEYDKRIDPRGQKYFWLTGEFRNEEPTATDTDEWALANGYVSIVPTKIDLTAYDYINNCREKYEK